MPSLRRASGCLFGLACGDALGAPSEFLSVDELARFPPDGPLRPELTRARNRRYPDGAGCQEALMQTPRPIRRLI
jgi:hypothetical protein